MKIHALIASVAIMMAPTIASAQTPTCDALSGEQRAVAQKVLETAYPYACCDETIAACLKSGTKCKLPTLLANEVCRHAGNGKTDAEIKHLLDQRAMAMGDLTRTAIIEKSKEHIWGNPNAKAVLSIYLCGRCPYCSRHIPSLVKALENSPLKDKVALNLRLFPIKSHENSTPAALAIEAAAQMGKAWPYLLKVYENFDGYDNEKLGTWAAELGLDKEQFTSLTQDAAVRGKVVTSKKEGLTNSVDSTPTFFLNGKKIQTAFDVDSIMSMLEEVADTN